MRPADQRQAAAQLNTVDLFTLADDVSDKKRDGGDVGEGRGYEDAAPKDMPFLPGYAGPQKERNALTHPGMLFPFSLMDAGGKKEEKEEEELSGSVPPLSAGRPRGRARRKRGRRGSDFLPPNQQRLPMKRDAVQLNLWGDVGVILTQGRSVTHAAQRLLKGLKRPQ